MPDREILSVLELLDSDETTIFLTYPVLTDEKTLLDMKMFPSLKEDMLFRMKQFFFQLMEDINSSILKQLKSQEKKIENLFRDQSEYMKKFKNISQINELKSATLSFKTNSEEKLHDHIFNHINCSKSNTKLIKGSVQKISSIISQYN